VGLAQEGEYKEYIYMQGTYLHIFTLAPCSLIAIMLIRLRMTASEALRQYFKLAGKIFSKKNTKGKGKEGAFKASTLEASVKEIVVNHEKKHRGGASMLPSGDKEARAKG
jgi:hypothetical protein